MPLIDDQTRVTDRRPAARWPWVLVVGGLCLLWLFISLVISFGPRVWGRPAAQAPQAAVGRFNQQQLQMAQQMAGWGQWQEAAAAVQAIDTGYPMSISDKHTYFRTGGQALTKSGSPLAGAGYYERFLTMSVRIHAAECRDCHSPASIPPVRVADMKTSTLGTSYTSALRSAGKLRETRVRLQAALRKKRGDPALHLLLYHVEIALKNHRAAAGHLEALKQYDVKQTLAR
jgi:hypothetical protein